MKVKDCKTGDRVLVYLNTDGGIYWPHNIKTDRFVIGTILKATYRWIIGYKSQEKPAGDNWCLSYDEKLQLPGCNRANYIDPDVECLSALNRRILQ